jgi:ATP synthase F0 subunit b
VLNISLVNIAFTIINLLILYVVFKKFLFQRVDAILKIRQEEVDDATEAANKAIEEAVATKREYEQKITLADEEKETILSDIKKQGFDEYEKIVMDARKKSDQIIKEARYNAKEEAKRAREEYADELKDMVIDAATKIAATKHTSEEDKELYDAFIDKAGAVK